MHRADPLKRKAEDHGRVPLLSAESIQKFEATQSGGILATATNTAHLRFAPRAGFETVEITAIISEHCYFHIGHLP
jgi:hypothetical protein